MLCYILNLLDLLTTAVALDLGGIERNPVAAVGLLIAYLEWKGSRRVIRFLCWLHAAVVAWNCYVIYLLGGALW